MSGSKNGSRGPVVFLADRRIEPMSRGLSLIESHWNAVRAGRLLPDRCDIDPRALTGALEHAFILERLATGLARFRLAGAHLTGLAGLEVRGLPISALFAAESRRVLSDAIATVFDEPATVRLSLESPADRGRPELRGEMTLLPLRSDLGDVTRILGGLAMSGQPGRAPRKLTIVGQARHTLTGYAGTSEGHAPMGSGLAPLPRPNLPSRPPVAGRPALRLVVDNDG